MVAVLDGVLTKRVFIMISSASLRMPVTRNMLKLVQDLAQIGTFTTEVFIRTTDRTVLFYLMKPVSDHVEHVFRDE